jgi:small subunit ribosomal protein S6
MNNYESIVILKPTLTEDEKEKLLTKIEKAINKTSKVTSKEIWGLRKLAYTVMKFNEGIYALFNFTSDPEYIQNINEFYNNTEDIIKHIIVKKD